MKKFISLLAVCAVSVVSLAGCGGSQGSTSSSVDAVEKYGSDTLKLYNWGEYLGEDVISNFEEQFGVDVIVE